MNAPKKYTYSTKTIRKSAVLSLAFKGLSMLLSLISAPLLLEILGEYRYGVWASIGSMISWVYMCDLGIGNGLRNKLAISFVNNDRIATKNYISIAYILVGIISVICFLAAVIFTFFVDFEQLLGVSLGTESIDAVFIVAVAFVCTNFVASLVYHILYAMQKTELVNAYAFFAQIVNVFGLMLCHKFSFQFVMDVVIVEGVSQLIKNIAASWNVFRNKLRLMPGFIGINWEYRKGIVSFGIQAFMIQVSSQILNSTDNIVILRCIGAEDVTPYSFCYKYFGIIFTVYNILLSPLWSAYTMAYEKKDYAWIKKTFAQSFRWLVLFCCGSIIAMFLFIPFSQIWLHKSLDYQKGLIFLTVMFYILEMVMNTFLQLCLGVGKVKKLFFISMIQAVVNIPVSVFFVKYCGLGVNGVILGSIVVVFIGCFSSMVQAIKILKGE